MRGRRWLLATAFSATLTVGGVLAVGQSMAAVTPPVSGAADRYATPTIAWNDCSTVADPGERASLQAAGAQCGQMAVPLDYNHPDGRHITGIYFPHVLKEFSAIKRFVVVQDRPDHVRLDLVVLPGWSRDDEVKLQRGIGAVLGPMVQLDVSLVDDIPLTRSGKHPVVLNMCQDGPAER